MEFPRMFKSRDWQKFFSSDKYDTILYVALYYITAVPTKIKVTD